MKRLLLAGTLATAAMVAASPARADMRKGAVELGAFAFFALYDGDSNVDDTTGFGGRLGILFAEQHELEFTYENASTEDDFAGLDVDLDTFKAGYVFNFLPDRAVSPFLTVGGGFQKADIQALNEDFTDWMNFGGGGVRLFLGSSFHIRLDGQAQIIFPEDSHDVLWDTLFQGGLGWVLGG